MAVHLITIIVPVYNACRSLKRCLDSLRFQVLCDFEVLLVDDGSTDESGFICDEYAKKDCRFKVIHKENGGVSSARQCGLDNAQGEYVIHVDPDDWVEPGMLEVLWKKAKSDNADMVICDYYEDRDGQSRYVSQKPSSLEHENVLFELFQQLHGSCCNKLVKRTCYSRYGIKFPQGLSFCEDEYVNALLLQEDIKVTYLSQAFYHYCITGSGLTHRGLAWVHSQQIQLYQALRKDLKPQYHEKCLVSLENDIAIGTLSLEQQTDFDHEALKNFKTAFPNLYRNYRHISCPVLRRLYYFLSFHNLQRLVRFILRIKREKVTMVTVKNLHGTTDCQCCDSWFAHWCKHTGGKGKYSSLICRCCGKVAAEPVGGHVIKTNSTDDSKYIVPLCKSCNEASNEDEIDVKLEDLVRVSACSDEE